MNRYLVKDCSIVTRTGIIESGSIEITNGMISNVYRSDEKIFDLEKYASIINAKDLIATPGFIDLHTHGCVGCDAMDASLESLSKISKYHLEHGVTSYLATPMTSSSEKIIEALRSIDIYMKNQALTKKNPEAEIIGSYLEGPFFSKIKKGAQPESDILEPDISILDEYIEVSNGSLKVVSLAPELPKAIQVIKYLKSKNIIPAIGHSNALYNEAKMAIKEGAGLATHLFNGMREFTHREPGIIGAVLESEQIYGEIIADMVHIHEAAINIAIKAKTTDKIVLISDSIRATGMEDGEYDLAGQRIVTKNGVALLNGDTLAGSTLNLLTAVKNLHKSLKLPLHEIIKMASYNPAKAIGIDKLYGSIEKEKIADIILLDKKLNLQIVIKRGFVIKN